MSTAPSSPSFSPSSLMDLFDPLSVPFDSHPPIDVLLPDPPSATAAERTAHRAAVAKRRGGQGRAVLVVDSAPIARKFLMRRLQGLGYAAQGAENGEQALGLIEQQRFAIVFLELKLRGDIDGLSLCQAIKQMPAPEGGTGPAVVVATGESGSSNKVRGSLAGCDAYLTKPLLDAKFIAALKLVDPLFS